jgi:hypothetical protein
VKRPAPELEHARPHGDDASTDDGGQLPSERRTRGRERACSIASGLVLALALLAGCATEPRPPVPNVAAELDAIASRICDQRAAIADLNGVCRRECVAGVDRTEVHAGLCVVHVACDCSRPNVGMRRLPKTSSPATARVPEEHGSAPSQAPRDELGAARGEDRADAGLVLSNRSTNQR